MAKTAKRKAAKKVGSAKRHEVNRGELDPLKERVKDLERVSKADGRILRRHESQIGALCEVVTDLKRFVASLTKHVTALEAINGLVAD